MLTVFLLARGWRDPTKVGVNVTWMRILIMEGSYFIGVLCVRNNEGEFSLAQTKCKFARMLNVVKREANVLLDTIQLALNKRWDRLMFESDSKF
jgi:hypothetical protein